MIRQIVVRSQATDQGQKTLSKRLSEGYKVVRASEYIPPISPYSGDGGFIEYILEIELPEVLEE